MAEKRLLGLNRRLHKTTYSVGVRRIKDHGTSTRSAKSAQEGVGRKGEGKEGGARAWKGKEKPASHSNLRQ
jgi:hypothetical protein